MPKFDKILCPFAGCNFTVNLDKEGTEQQIRDRAAYKMDQHRASAHRGHHTLTSYHDGKKWEYENSL